MSGTITTNPSDPLFYPIVLTQAGVQPQLPADLRAQLLTLVATGVDIYGNQVLPPLPGYTANLPGSLIEDIASTDTGALIVCDQARVETINSLTPYGCNSFLMAQLGQLFGIPFGTTTNVSVEVVFSGTVGFVINAGFQVGDGSYTYVVQSATIVGQGGQSAQVQAVASTTGSWPVPAGTVTQLVTSVPSAITLTVNNPLEGSGGNTQETEQAYRVRILQAGIVACQGTPAFLKTLLEKIPGVLPQQVSVVSAGSSWKVICGGASADPFAIANAIYQATPVVGNLIGSTMSMTAATNANPGLVTTLLNHGYANGQVVTFSGVNGMTQLNTGSYTITVVTEKSFTIGVNTTSFGTYTSGGVVAPNLRNNLIDITDYPDTYPIPFITPPMQTVILEMTWSALGNVAVEGVIDQLAQTAIVNAINEIPAGAPINLIELQDAVQDAIEPQIDLSQISQITWTVAINGVSASPSAGTQIIYGDPESYFFITAGGVTVTKV